MIKKTRKSELTREKIRDAALASFVEKGFTETTMRAVAESAGVSPSNAYYYYPSKTHLVQELYERVQEEHRELGMPRLSTVTALPERIRIALESGLDAVTPYEKIAPGFLTAMISPDSPLNPFSAESTTAREMTIALFREAVDGSRHRVPDDIVAALPEALYALHLALILRWSYDRSEGKRDTRRLLSTGMRLLSLALPFTRVPGVHATTRELLTHIAEIRS